MCARTSLFHLVEPEVEAGDPRSLVGLLTEQVEFANVILINKIETLDLKRRLSLRKVLTCLNPEARLLECSQCEVDFAAVLATKTFSEEKAATMAGWYKELDGSLHLPESEEFGIASFVYRARRPFTPTAWMRFSTARFRVCCAARATAGWRVVRKW